MSSQSVQIEFAPEFKRNLRGLAKKYRHIRDDVEPLVERLRAGEMPGAQVPGMDYAIFKVRVRNSDLQKGKSSGYRVLYYLKTNTRIVLMTVYSKLERADISAKQLHDFLQEYAEKGPASPES